MRGLKLWPVVLGRGEPFLAGARSPLRLVANDLIGEDAKTKRAKSEDQLRQLVPIVLMREESASEKSAAL